MRGATPTLSACAFMAYTTLHFLPVLQETEHRSHCCHQEAVPELMLAVFARSDPHPGNPSASELARRSRAAVVVGIACSDVTA